MAVGFHKIVDGEVILAVIEARATADDLLELKRHVGTNLADLNPS